MNGFPRASCLSISADKLIGESWTYSGERDYEGSEVMLDVEAFHDTTVKLLDSGGAAEIMLAYYIFDRKPAHLRGMYPWLASVFRAAASP